MYWVYLSFILAFCLIVCLVFLFKINQAKSSNAKAHALENEKTKELINRLEKETEMVHTQLNNLLVEKKELENQRIVLVDQNGELRATVNQLEKSIEQQKELFKDFDKRYKEEFENLAVKIIQAKSDEIEVIQTKNLGNILNPFKDKLNTFEKKVNDIYLDETKERASLKSEIENLIKMSSSIGEEAKNLTNALKGDNKLQGNWGELILERVLESSGLVKGQEYHIQDASTNQDGERIMPDVIVQLPDNKHIIIDSKVSLIAYEQLAQETDQDKALQMIKNHIASVKSHIKKLSDKNYWSSKKYGSPDFVLLFMPLEASFSVALKEEPDLYAFAWKHKIVLVSPTTLLATLKTIHYIWNQEKQARNVELIMEEASKMYDKFVGFLEDMNKIDGSLIAVRKHYENAKNKLNTGTGNLVRRAERIRELGVGSAKNIPKT